jgi:hypothetical protein
MHVFVLVIIALLSTGEIQTLAPQAYAGNEECLAAAQKFAGYVEQNPIIDGTGISIVAATAGCVPADLKVPDMHDEKGAI